MYPFERFTERARGVLTLAQQEAEAAHHTYIGTEHLLLGLLRDEGGIARAALNALGVEEEPAREAIMAMLGKPRHIVQQIVPTSRVKRVIELAFETSRQMGNPFVGTEHLLLGVLLEGQGVAAKVLLDMGVTLERAREEVDRQLAAAGTEPPGGPVAPRQPLSAALPMAADVRRLMLAASALADGRGAASVNLDVLLDAMISSAGIEALARLLDVRRHAAAKEQAIASQDYEAAAGHRMAERQAREALDEAIVAWRRELEPPAQNVS
jgi:ATP-dependent Clp protease ATP-binding subunit ClpA